MRTPKSSTIVDKENTADKLVINKYEATGIFLWRDENCCLENQW